MTAKKNEETAFVQINAWIDDLNKEFKGQSDRGLAVVAGSMLDAFLTIVLSGFFIREAESRALGEQLFESQGPLSTFSSKIKLVFALGLIGLDERHELEVIRRIRNDFAHQLGTVSFGDPTVKARCDSLLLPERMYVPDVIPVPKSADGPLPTVDLHFPSNVSARERFRMSVIYLMHNLTARFADGVHERRSIPADFQSPEEMWTHYLARIEAMMQEKDELTQRLNELEQQLGEPQSEVSNSDMVASAHTLTKYLVQLLERSRQAHDR